MQHEEVKQIGLANYQQLQEAQSQSQAQHDKNQSTAKCAAIGQFVFQIDSPKQQIIELMHAQYKTKVDKPIQIEKGHEKIETQLTPFSYELELTSEQSQSQRQNNEQLKRTNKEAQINKQQRNNCHQKVQPKNQKNTDKVIEDQREDRMKRRKKKNTLKDIFNDAETNHQKSRPVDVVSTKNQVKNIEYAKTQQHNQVPQLENQRTDTPLKQDPLTIAERIEGVREQKEQKIKEIRQTKLPPLKRIRNRNQQQQPSHLIHNDSSIMALDKFTEFKNKDQSIVAVCYQQGIFKHFAFKPIPIGSNLKFMFKRQKKCLENYYHPQYSLVFKQNKHIFSARKEWGHINSHYNISCQEKNYTKTGSYYAGYLKGNFTGTCFNLFSSNDLAAELVATIIYKAELSCIQQSYRQFEIYIKNQDYAYSELAGFRQGQLIDLQELFEVSDNARLKKIKKLANKKAEWCQSLSAYVMDFKGKLKIPSVKNMILVQQGRQHQNVLMLCKQQQNEFYLEITNPLDPFLAIGIVLSSFDFKLLCQ